MTPADCLFCKILARKVPAAVVYENDAVLAIKDINPQAPVHLLVLTKKHLSGIHEIGPENTDVLGPLIEAANKLAKDHRIDASGYRLVVNRGAEGGQTVDHLHVHLLGGRPMSWPPG